MVDVAKSHPTRRKGRPPRTAEQRAANRSSLVAGAIAAIRELGPELTLDELAAGAGVTKPVLYDEFGGRIGVADAIAEQLTLELERTVARQLGNPRVGVDQLIHAITDAFITLIDDDNDLYEFVVRAYMSDGRPLLSNPIVRLLHERVEPLVSVRSDVGAEELRILTDGLYGFVLAAIQSWKAERTLSREAMVAMISNIVREALVVMATPSDAKLPHPD